MAQLEGCCSRMYRFILVVLNVIIFILGLLTLIFAAVMKWTDVFNKVLNLGALDDIVDLGKIGSVAILFMIIGAFALLLSLIGLFGLCCLSKFLLIVYEVVVIILFAAHGIGLLVLVFGQSTIENEFKKGMTEFVDRLNGNYTNKDKFTTDCDAMKTLSELFDCCGDKLPTDITNSTIRGDCCQPKTNPAQHGCTDKTINSIVSNAKSYLIIPSAVILAIELMVIIITPLMICDIKKYSGDASSYGFRPKI